MHTDNYDAYVHWKKPLSRCTGRHGILWHVRLVIILQIKFFFSYGVLLLFMLLINLLTQVKEKTSVWSIKPGPSDWESSALSTKPLLWTKFVSLAHSSLCLCVACVCMYYVCMCVGVYACENHTGCSINSSKYLMSYPHSMSLSCIHLVLVPINNCMVL